MRTPAERDAIMAARESSGDLAAAAVEVARAARQAGEESALMTRFVLEAADEAYARRIREAEAKTAKYHVHDGLTDAQRTLASRSVVPTIVRAR